MALPPQRPPFRPGGPARPGAPAAPEDPAAARRQSEELSDACGKLEEELEALRARYELYFLGVERREPNRWRDEVKKKVNRLKESFTRNTGLKFRLQSLHARCISYERLWLRSVREKEEGTYRRDLIRARRKGEQEARRQLEKRKDAAPAAGPTPIREAAAASGSAKPVPDPTAAAAPLATPGRSAASLPPGMNEQQLRALYGAYVDAKKRCNEDVSRLSYEVLARSVAKQVPELMSKYKARTVEFKVVIKEGRAILKAVPHL